jgi:hypothetical protein
VTGAGEWLTLAELTGRTGRTPAAVRSWMRRRRKEGRLRTQRNNRGETQIWATAEHLAELGQGRDPGDDRISDPGVTGLLEEVAELRHALGRAEGELAAEQRRNAELVAPLTAALAKAEARRPWLAKVIDGLRRR